MSDNPEFCQVASQPEGGTISRCRALRFVGLRWLGWFADEGRRWGRGEGCRSIGGIGHWVVWLASRQMRVFTGWATLVESPVCVPVGRDGFWWDRRLSGRYRRMTTRGKEHNKVVVAIARELVGFLWATLAVEERAAV